MTKDRRKVSSEDLKNEVLAKIEEYQTNGFPEAARIHELIMQANPDFCPRLWYGMPGYAKSKDSAVLCFFRKDTLISFGITESVDLAQFMNDEKSVIPSAWYVVSLSSDAEKQILSVVSKIT